MAYGRIGVIGAMDSELAALIAALTQPAQETVQGLVFRTGRLGAREVVLVRCGIGKVSAARCTQALIDRFAPGAVINTGIAGGLASGLAVGDIVVADGLVQHDFDAAPIGFVRGCVCMGDPGAPTVFAPDAVLSALLAQTAGNAIGAQRVHRGLVATGDQFISGAAAK
ncbi:MTA/SAH nucleosidase, partial [human gut metagenome]